MRAQATLRPLLAASLVSVAVAVVGCGGGGDSPTPAAPAPAPTPNPPPPPPTTAVNVSVIDGALRNVRVCLDVNGNGGCDSGEPAAVTDPAGAATLTVPNDLLGRHPVVAVVGTDAVDADFGPVKLAYTMTAPADKTAVVSPLTTLAQQLVQSVGLTSDAADAQLQASGVTVSAYQNYVARRAREKASADAGLVAATVAATLQQQFAAWPAPLASQTRQAPR